MSDYRTCTPEEALELSRAIEHDLRERVRELSAENDRLLDINADLYEALFRLYANAGVPIDQIETEHLTSSLDQARAALAKARGERDE
jgi:hypothetical protein